MKSNICMGLFVLAVLFAGIGASSPRAVRPVTEPIVFTAAPIYAPLAWMEGGERFPNGATLYYRDTKGTRKLFAEFAATADANISFDAGKILFAGKKSASDPWQIWEASFDGSAPRQVTHAAGGAVRPFYLPGERFVYSALVSGKFVLVTAALDGADEQRISFTNENVLASDVLRDGRILLQSVDATGTDQPEMFAVYSDGSGFESIRCDHGAPRYAGRELTSGDIVFTHGTKLAYFSSPFAVEQAIDLKAEQFAGDVAETASQSWIVSSAAGPNKKFSLHRWKPRAGVLIPFASMPDQNLIQPAVRAERKAPNKHPSGLHDWKYANLLALNIYTSKLPIPDHSVSAVKVYTRDISGSEKFLGSAPVETDGSFFVRVPGDSPIRFELSDANGKSIAREQGWFWARGGEQRICVGCHAGPERAPENAVPMVLQKSTEPVDMTQTFFTSSGGR